MNTMDYDTVKPRFTGPRFAGEPRIAGQMPADRTFCYINFLQKPRFAGHKTPIYGISFFKSSKIYQFLAQNSPSL